jgi:formylmethanofuran dehydrogenase subunit D
MRVILNTGRTTEQGVALELSKSSEEYYKKVALALLNGRDMDDLGLQEDMMVKVSTKFGSVVVRCKGGKLDRGNVFMTLGPWASLIIGVDTGGTGMPLAKGVEAEVSRTEDELTSLNRVLEILKGF